MDIAIFSPSSLFFEEQDDVHTSVEENAENQESFVERKHQFPGMELVIREFSFHQLNANLLWPGTFAFAECANDLPVIPHIKHTWGDKFPNSDPDWDLIIASDILLYVKQYPNLIQTITFLLKSYKPRERRTTVSQTGSDDTNVAGDVVLPWPAFLMSWRRRIGKEDESIFFNGCEKAGLEVNHIGSRVYCISLIENEESNKCLKKEDSVQVSSGRK
ncbi:unnamed protein product [Vicia faba]|uniref:S-adenosyl-L-methionine-dependent methyltransferase n=1 Tax=Vicia faba TaxID=3906 RepID=A0AAV1A413_VICFA|nr:unnamed protein product [Vicia faba]CAI8603630.1 unnamed protein product [Vicia faba]